MTRDEIKQSATHVNDATHRIALNDYGNLIADALIAADELIDKLEADKAKLREALVSVAAYPGVDKYLGLQITSAISKALKDTSDE